MKLFYVLAIYPRSLSDRKHRARSTYVIASSPDEAERKVRASMDYVKLEHVVCRWIQEDGVAQGEFHMLDAKEVGERVYGRIKPKDWRIDRNDLPEEA